MNKIELTPQTIDILKNFATINPNILIQPGKTISTIAEAGNMFAYAEVTEEFDSKFGIFDLTSFLAILSSFENPVLTFSEEKNTLDQGSKHVTITEKDGKGSFKYFGSPEKVLKFVTKKFVMPPTVAEFEVSKINFTRTLRAGQTAQLPHFMIESNGKQVDLVVGQVGEASANSFRLEVSDTKTDKPFTMVLMTSFLKLIPDSYKIALDGKLVAEFVSSNKKLYYYITVEKLSTYGKTIDE